MLTVAAVIFAIAALGGLTVAYLSFTKNTVPTWLAMVHGAVAATGLVLLAIVVTTGEAAGMLTVSLLIFLAAALGGFTLFFGFQLRNKPLPRALIVIHGLAAATAFVLLVLFLFGS